MAWKTEKSADPSRAVHNLNLVKVSKESVNHRERMPKSGAWKLHKSWGKQGTVQRMQETVLTRHRQAKASKSFRLER